MEQQGAFEGHLKLYLTHVPSLTTLAMLCHLCRPQEPCPRILYTNSVHVQRSKSEVENPGSKSPQHKGSQEGAPDVCGNAHRARALDQICSQHHPAVDGINLGT